MKCFLTKSKRLLLVDVIMSIVLGYLTYYTWTNPTIGITPFIPGVLAIVFFSFSLNLCLLVWSGIADILDKLDKL